MTTLRRFGYATIMLLLASGCAPSEEESGQGQGADTAGSGLSVGKFRTTDSKNGKEVDLIIYSADNQNVFFNLVTEGSVVAGHATPKGDKFEYSDKLTAGCTVDLSKSGGSIHLETGMLFKCRGQGILNTIGDEFGGSVPDVTWDGDYAPVAGGDPLAGAYLRTAKDKKPTTIVLTPNSGDRDHLHVSITGESGVDSAGTFDTQSSILEGISVVFDEPGSSCSWRAVYLGSSVHLWPTDTGKCPNYDRLSGTYFWTAAH
jgi:hypothetical protein